MTGWSKPVPQREQAGGQPPPGGWPTAHASAGHSSNPPRAVSAVIA